MTTEYTPTTREVKEVYAQGLTRRWGMFDRWLAADHREVAVKTLREAAQIVDDTACRGLGLATAAVRLSGEADRIEREEQSND